MPALALSCHPAVPCAYVRAVSVAADWSAGNVLELRYRVEGDLEQLQIPAPRPEQPSPEPTDDLWRHTCFEAFVKSEHAPGYLELNVSPSGEWALYGFDGYRNGMQPRTPQHPPLVVCRRNADSLETHLHVRLDGLLPRRDGAADLRVGLAAVLEDRRGTLSYWALAHPTERPDFHHADSFVFHLSEPGAAA